MRTRLAAILLASALATPAPAAELEAGWNGHFVHLSLAGSFSQYTIERTRAESGVWRLLEWNPIGCTAECNYDDYGIDEGVVYEYRVRVLLPDGSEQTFGPTRIGIDPGATGGLEVSVAPHPVTDGTTLRFHIPGPVARGGEVEARFVLHDPTGREVRTLHAGPLPAGRHSITWDGRDGGGRLLPTGTYFYRLEVAGVGETGRLIVLR